VSDARFRYHVFDLVTLRTVDEVPFDTLHWTRVLDRPGGWTASIDARNEKATGSTLEPGRVGVAVELGGLVLFAGPIWPRSGKVDGVESNLDLGGQGILSCWRGPATDYGRHLLGRDGMTHATGAADDVITWTDVDYFHIVADLFAHAASFAGTTPLTIENRGTGPGGLCGATTSRTFYVSERKNIGDLLEELAAEEPGFDFGVDWHFSTDVSGRSTVVPVLTLENTRGTITDITLHEKVDVAVLEHALDGVSANVLLLQGQGAGADALTTEVTAAASIAPVGVFPRLERRVTARDAKTVEELVSLGAGMIGRAGRPLFTATLDVIDAQLELVATLREGDVVYLEAHDGAIDVDDYLRVITIDGTIDVDSNFALKLGCASLDHYPEIVAP